MPETIFRVKAKGARKRVFVEYTGRQSDLPDEWEIIRNAEAWDLE